MKVLFYICMITLSCTACTSGEVIVEASPYLNKKGKIIEKVISINPEFQVVSAKKSGTKLVKISGIKQAEFIQQLEYNAKKFNIEFLVYDPSLERNTIETQNYFNDLLPLKEAVIQNMRFQDISTGRHPRKRSRLFNPPYHEFHKTFQLPTHFSSLSKKYGTPYFALHGVIAATSGKSQMLYYTVWINVESSEIVYREIRIIENKPRPLFLNAIIYDSFHIVAAS